MSDTQSSNNTAQLLPGTVVDRRYGICSRTRARWKNNPDLNFPKPAMSVNGREYYDENQLIAWERSQASKVRAA